MKQKVFKTCVMLIAFFMLPSMTEAKKIKFGQYITYNGAVANDLPMGKGKLTIENKDPAVKKPAIVEGTFDGWSVETLNSAYFYSQERSPSFRGKLEIIIAGDGNSVTFKLINGRFSDYLSEIALEEVKQLNLEITCTPKEDGIYLYSTPFASIKEIKNKEKESKFPHKYSSFLPDSGVKWTSTRTCKYEGKNKALEIDYFEEVTPVISNGKQNYILRKETLTKEIDAVTLVYDLEKRDDSPFHNESDYLVSFKIEINEGTLDYKNDTLIYTDLQSKRHTVLYYDTNERTSPEPDHHIIREYNIKLFDDYKIKERGLKSLYSLGLRVIEGPAYSAARQLIGKVDKKAMFDLAMAFFKGDGVKADEKEGNFWMEEAYRYGSEDAKAYYAELKAKEDEKQQKVIESYGAHQNNGGLFFVNNMEAIKAGIDRAKICVGLCYQFGYGINKNLQKAFEYYKKAAESSDEAVKACGNFLMGMCYWKGEGTAKNQVQAYKAWTRYSDYTKSMTNWNDFTDWIDKWTNNELKQLVKPREMLGYKHYYHAQCYEQGIGTQVYLEEAIGFYNAAVQWTDIADAWYKIGYYTEKGKWRAYFNGIPNRDYAAECYRKAASLGSSKAKQALNRM